MQSREKRRSATAKPARVAAAPPAHRAAAATNTAQPAPASGRRPGRRPLRRRRWHCWAPRARFSGRKPQWRLPGWRYWRWPCDRTAWKAERIRRNRRPQPPARTARQFRRIVARRSRAVPPPPAAPARPVPMKKARPPRRAAPRQRRRMAAAAHCAATASGDSLQRSPTCRLRILQPTALGATAAAPSACRISRGWRPRGQTAAATPRTAQTGPLTAMGGGAAIAMIWRRIRAAAPTPPAPSAGEIPQSRTPRSQAAAAWPRKAEAGSSAADGGDSSTFLIGSALSAAPPSLPAPGAARHLQPLLAAGQRWWHALRRQARLRAPQAERWRREAPQRCAGWCSGQPSSCCWRRP